MGNKNPKPSVVPSSSVDGIYIHHKENDLSQKRANSNLSLPGRSIESFNNSSRQSVYSVSRPWSRVARRRWKASNAILLHETSRTNWPVSQLESYFLPEFPLTASQNERKFDIIEEVNKGAFGIVYKARSVETDEFVAFKVLSKSKIIEDNSVQQVKDEVRIQEVCGHHPFIVSYKLRWQNKNQLYIVSAFIEGGELYELLEKYVILPISVVQIYIAQIALALDFLHNAGIIYRDLKPENILLDNNGNIQLIDFGLSKWLSYGAMTRTVCGTLRYMAPEILALKPYGHAADWWSLGVLACQMFTYKFPKLVSDEQENGSSRVVLPDNVEIDAASRDLLLRLLEKDPTKRLRSIRTLQTIAFYKGYNFDDVRKRKITPYDVLELHFPNGPPKVDEDSFEDDNN